jgi:hypothetical protein
MPWAVGEGPSCGSGSVAVTGAGARLGPGVRRVVQRAAWRLAPEPIPRRCGAAGSSASSKHCCGRCGTGPQWKESALRAAVRSASLASYRGRDAIHVRTWWRAPGELVSDPARCDGGPLNSSSDSRLRCGRCAKPTPPDPSALLRRAPERVPVGRKTGRSSCSGVSPLCSLYRIRTSTRPSSPGELESMGFAVSVIEARRQLERSFRGRGSRAEPMFPPELGLRSAMWRPVSGVTVHGSDAVATRWSISRHLGDA